MPNPTPKLTAENVADEIHRAHDAMIRRKAFEQAAEAVEPIGDLIETVENRCMAADGPVTPTEREISREEVKLLLKLSWGAVLKLRALAKEKPKAEEQADATTKM